MSDGQRTQKLLGTNLNPATQPTKKGQGKKNSVFLQAGSWPITSTSIDGRTASASALRLPPVYLPPNILALPIGYFRTHFHIETPKRLFTSYLKPLTQNESWRAVFPLQNISDCAKCLNPNVMYVYTSSVRSPHQTKLLAKNASARLRSSPSHKSCEPHFEEHQVEHVK